jgi:hypothetical protein
MDAAPSPGELAVHHHKLAEACYQLLQRSNCPSGDHMTAHGVQLHVNVQQTQLPSSNISALCSVRQSLAHLKSEVHVKHAVRRYKLTN